MKNIIFVPKDIQRILSSHKVSEKYYEQEVFYKKFFLIISQYSQKNTCVGVSFLIKMQAFKPETLFKRGSTLGVFL